MAWEVIFSARSRKDLEQIVSYIARDDPAAAERFGLKLIDQAESLADAPEMDQGCRRNRMRDFCRSDRI